MSNLELKPAEIVCRAEEPAGPIEILMPRDVPLGGPRAMNVRRTLPQRKRSLIGAWCFIDHYGPDDVRQSSGMEVPPHPHTGLQTVSWLFTGGIEHRDSAGFRAMVRPSELNLMTAGSGISHSEVSTPETTALHGVQLWVALPAAARFIKRTFTQYVPPVIEGEGFELRVFLGSLAGSASRVATHSPLLGAELLLRPGASVRLAVDPTHEHGILVDSGELTVAGFAVDRHQLAYVPAGAAELELSVEEGTRILLLGGPPFGESIVMWWNFVGRSHDEIIEYRRHWQSEITAEPADTPEMFGLADDDPLPPLRASALPNARLRPRS